MFKVNSKDTRTNGLNQQQKVAILEELTETEIRHAIIRDETGALREGVITNNKKELILLNSLKPKTESQLEKKIKKQNVINDSMQVITELPPTKVVKTY